MDTNKITIVDDKGNEIEYDVLFTFENDDQKYVLYYDASLDQPSVYASIYNDEGELFPIETPEQWDMVEEVFQSFTSEDEQLSQEGCHECCHGENECCDGEDCGCN